MHALFVAIGLLSANPVVPAAIWNASCGNGGERCPREIEDASAPGNCLSASTVPTLGALYPLSAQFFVDSWGRVGVGTTVPSGNVHIRGTQTTLRIDDDVDPASYFEVQNHSSNLVRLRKFAASGTASIDLTPVVLDGVSGSYVRLFRNVTTAGPKLLQLHKGDGTSTVDVQIAAGGTNSFFRQGNVGIGTSAPSSKLDVNGETATDTLRIRGGADVVENFKSQDDTLEPGTVVALDSTRAGEVVATHGAYDKKVIGVVSGAGGVNPGLVLSQEGVLDGNVQVAMVGRVYVKCNAENGPIEPGDLLTTASLAGHAMAATDSERAFGAVIGKAAGSLTRGTGLVLVVVNLQ